MEGFCLEGGGVLLRGWRVCLEGRGVCIGWRGVLRDPNVSNITCSGYCELSYFLQGSK